MSKNYIYFNDTKFSIRDFNKFKIGDKLPDFKLTTTDLKNYSLYNDTNSKYKIIYTLPSIDTSTCQTSSIQLINKIKEFDAQLIIISQDLPFAQNRFVNNQKCINNDKVVCLSAINNKDFGLDFGLDIIDGPFVGLLARAILIINSNNELIYKEIVNPIQNEPNYENIFKELN